jgi:hypothetical protein
MLHIGPISRVSPSGFNQPIAVVHKVRGDLFYWCFLGGMADHPGTPQNRLLGTFRIYLASFLQPSDSIRVASAAPTRPFIMFVFRVHVRVTISQPADVASHAMSDRGRRESVRGHKTQSKGR